MKVIRRLAQDSKNVSYRAHALERLDERNTIDILDVLKLLRLGEIEGAINPGKNPGEWSCLVTGKCSLDGRDAGVATIVVREEKLIIKTVEWMDR